MELRCCCCCCCCRFSRVRLCATPETAAHQAPRPGILQARTLEWVAISFSSAWKWKVKVKSLSRVWPSVTPWTAAFQDPPSMGFSRQEYWSGVPLPSPMFSYPVVSNSLQPYELYNGILQAGILEWIAIPISSIIVYLQIILNCPTCSASTLSQVFVFLFFVLVFTTANFYFSPF